MVKKTVTLLGIALIVFVLVTQPQWSANAVQGTLAWLRNGAEAVITFVENVFN